MAHRDRLKQDTEKAKATRILTVIVYVVWNYFLHLSYWYFDDSWLHYYAKRGEYLKLYGIHALHAFAVMLYLWVALLRSPGYVPLPLQAQTQNYKSPKYCAVCKIIRPRRSKHCYKCGKCIVKYDHHCLFTANCVGADNHGLFVFYLWIQLWFLAWSAPMSIHSVYCGMNNLSDIGWIQFLYRCVCCLGILFAFVGVALLCAFQIYLVSTNQTTYVYMKRYGFCALKNAKNMSYDSTHFEPAQSAQNKSVLWNIIAFLTKEIPNDWRITNDNIAPNAQWSVDNYADTVGVGCVPFPSFKQE